MKILYLIRHAKSSWANPDITDFERPLNSRGRKDAPAMGAYLKEKGINPQLLLSSPATRAITTANLIADELGHLQKDIKVNAKIYNASPLELMEVIHNLDDSKDSIAIFGHDTCITTVADDLAQQRILHFPTCGVVGIKLNIDKWADAVNGSGELLFFYFPKGLKEEAKATKRAGIPSNK